MKKTVDIAYDFGDIVYFKPATTRVKGIVVGIHFSPAWTPMFNVTWEDGDSGSHWDFELSKTFEKEWIEEEAE